MFRDFVNLATAKPVFFMIIIFAVLFNSGCSSSLSELAGPDGKINLLDPENSPYDIEIIERPNGRLDYYWDIDSSIEQADFCKLKYHSSYKYTRSIVVQGSIGQSDNTYPVLLDTGCSQPLFVREAHVRDNSLAVYPLKTGSFNGYQMALCHLPELKLGEISLMDWPCLYLRSGSRNSFFKLAAEHDNFMIVGLPLLMEFQYVLIDDANKAVELSNDKEFTPSDPDNWEKFPITIEEDLRGNAFLFVDIPIEARQTYIQIDTGSGTGLSVSQSLWNQLKEQTGPIKFSRTKLNYPYIGNLSCKRGKAESLSMGSKTIKNADIAVFADNCPLVEDCDGLIGMQFFRNSTIVLDFENDLLWIRSSDN